MGKQIEKMGDRDERRYSTWRMKERIKSEKRRVYVGDKVTERKREAESIRIVQKHRRGCI